MTDGFIRWKGTRPSHPNFRMLKFDRHGRQVENWGVFMAKSVDLTRDLTWGGDVVLKIGTGNLDRTMMEYDGHVSKREHGRSFVYRADIPVSEIVGVEIDEWFDCMEEEKT